MIDFSLPGDFSLISLESFGSYFKIPEHERRKIVEPVTWVRKVAFIRMEITGIEMMLGQASRDDYLNLRTVQ